MQSEIALQVARELFHQAYIEHCEMPAVAEIIDRHLAALTADNERLTRERDELLREQAALKEHNEELLAENAALRSRLAMFAPNDSCVTCRECGSVLHSDIPMCSSCAVSLTGIARRESEL